MRSVVITGVGLRTPLGHTLADARQTFAEGRPVLRGHTGPDGQLRAYADIADDIGQHFTPTQRLMLDRVVMLTLLAGESAIADAGLNLADADRDRVGVYLGTGQAAIHTIGDAMKALYQRDQMPAMTVLKSLPNGAAGQLSMTHGLRGECVTFSVACSSSNIALGHAMRAIRHGEVDVALAGGADAPLHESSLRCWEALRILAKVDPARPEACCRPFSADRTGLALGEGAAIFVLEAEDVARARGARILARLAGYGSSANGTHITAPSQAGQCAAMRHALRDAGLSAADIGYINAHGTGTPAGDPTETQSIREVFGGCADTIPVSSTKSLHGHLLGASGAVELLAALVALRDGIIAPTANLEQPDPACDLDYVPIHARHGVHVEAALSNSFAFGGSNASLIVTRH